MGVPIGSLDAVVLTHFHSDHTAGLPDVWLTGWIGTPYGGREEAFRVIGPVGTTTLMEGGASPDAVDSVIGLGTRSGLAGAGDVGTGGEGGAGGPMAPSGRQEAGWAPGRCIHTGESAAKNGGSFIFEMNWAR